MSGQFILDPIPKGALWLPSCLFFLLNHHWIKPSLVLFAEVLRGYGIVGYVRREEKGEHRGMIGDAMWKKKKQGDDVGHR